MIQRVRKAINADTPHLNFVIQWFLKQDIPKIMMYVQKISIEPYTLKLAFEFFILRKIQLLCQNFGIKHLIMELNVYQNSLIVVFVHLYQYLY